MSDELRVMSIDEIRNKACQVIPLPGWEPGEVFNAKVRRASLLALVQQGVIPNELLPIVYKIISKGGEFNPMTDSTPEEFKQFIEMLNAICKAVLVEPAYDEVAEYLTDLQRTAIFLYTQQGLKALELFRARQEYLIAPGGDGEGVRGKAK
ncbi:MAG: hypothetical protein HPY52_10800 [Firmicutes bacterium]|nr:hypothetical protein [Bacillota bacterium]